MSSILELLREPAAKHIADIDSASTTLERWTLIKNKPFLKAIYSDWYQLLQDQIGCGKQPALEIGSGGGFLADYVPNLVTSDILSLPILDYQIDACDKLPFEDASLRAITMVNVFHHLPDCEQFLTESVRCLEPNGRLVMVEPWISSWSNFIYSRLHHEPCVTDTPSWQFESSGPLSGANGALPWIVFKRDLPLFNERFPQLRVTEIRPLMPFSYILSGGLSMRALLPASSYKMVRALETAFNPIMDKIAMFALIVVQRTNSPLDFKSEPASRSTVGAGE